MKEYFNYHRHTCASNIMTIDSPATNKDYAEKTIEYNHRWLSSCEHGGAVNWVDCYMVAKSHKLKYIHVGEFYFVPDRLKEKDKVIIDDKSDESEGTKKQKSEKDRSNYHLIIVAKNNDGFEAMNVLMSEANTSGYYYRPRIDLELLRKIPKDSVYVTTACIGSFLRDYPATKPILEEMIELFGDNLFLEVQNHDTDKQKKYNELMLEIANEYNLKIIAGADSHIIENSQHSDRDYLLHSKGIIYEDEGGWVMDYVDRDTMKERFLKQGVLDNKQIEEALDNTLILTKTDEIVIDTKMKVPTIFLDKDRPWKLGHFKKLLFDRWNEYKEKIPLKNRDTYINELLVEYSVIEETKMEDYFLTNYYIIKKGIDYGGILTKTGRGSGASYLTNLILGFTTIDRLKAKVPILRERFMGKARIIENNSSPDID